MNSSVFSRFNPAEKPQSKPRANVGSFCLTQDFTKASWVLIGVPDDRGVENNYGRSGAKEGPRVFRERFFSHSIAYVSPAQHSIYDLGDLKLSEDLGDTLDHLKLSIAEIRKIDPKKKFLIVGGGHDIAYGEIAGCLELKSAKKHHIINIDAHSDVRPLENGNVITSGTPFYRLIEKEGIAGQNYHPFGLQKTSNSKELVEWMKKKKVDIHWLEDMPNLEEQIFGFYRLGNKMKGKPWHLSVDLDGFSPSAGEGVSAPAVMGLSPNIFLQIEKVKSFGSLKSLGFYELNPAQDNHGHTARLAAKLAYLILCHST